MYRLLLQLLLLAAAFLDGGLLPRHIPLALDGRLLLLRAGDESRDARDQVRDHRDEYDAGDLPGGDAHAAQGSARQGEEPLGPVREPAVGKPEDGLLAVPERQDELWAAGEDHACGGEVGIEF